eukprot:TRINITY_DN13869_c0_g1_i1.p1 TRINITY_DN13869_c0_g1~~TRINITY_DN13869_c0_g1_i1.p1  ORF type:complete len:1343 (-),score=367.63 TRINITY_DN13869_c0_g1_i1:24-4052(-)
MADKQSERSEFDELREDDDIEAGKISRPFPETTANWFSRITFWWVTPLCALGKRKPLEPDDLWQMAQHDRCATIGETFNREWSKEGKLASRPPSLIRTMHRSFGTYFYISGVIKLIHDILQFFSPMLLRALIAFTASYAASASGQPPTASQPIWIGILLALGLFGAAELQSLFIHQYFNRTFRTGMHVQSSIVSAVYRKTLDLSQAARQEQGAGNVVNVMSNDTEKLKNLFTYLHTIWSGPFQIIVSFVLLIREIGWISLSGAVVMVLLIPLNAAVARATARLRGQTLKFTDERVKWTNEILLGIKSIKLYAWEESFIGKLSAIREKELALVKKNQILQSFSGLLFVLTPVIVSIITFLLYTVVGGELDAQKAFVTISLLNIMRFPLLMLPQLVTGLGECKVSITRIEKFLLCDEVDTAAVERRTTPAAIIIPGAREPVQAAVAVCDGTFAWGEKTILNNINLAVPTGSLCMIIGAVGSGKTSLLSALNGEMTKKDGTVSVTGRVAFVSQEAWIQNMSLHDNIIFGAQKNKKQYEDTLRTCALLDDIRQLPGGDHCEIGERGINLSGGQKQRVNLARAVYSDADVYIMDDCLSAVDTHVGRHIFEECFRKKLANHTRIVATHQLQYLPKSDWVIVLEEGKVKHQGTYRELVASGVDFDALAAQEDTPAAATTADKTAVSGEAEAAAKTEKVTIEESAEQVLAAAKAKAAEAKKAGGLTTVEERETGSVGSHVYLGYAKATGSVPLMVGSIVMCAVAQCARSGADWWLSFWSQNASAYPMAKYFFVLVFVAFGVVAGILFLIRNLWVAFLGIRAARVLHERLMNAVLRTPMSFIDTTPTGRIINRFTKDTDVIDGTLPTLTGSYFNVVFTTLGSLVLVTVVSPWFLAPAAGMAVMYYFVQQYYRNTSRELKRLQSISRSPIFVHFSETLSGLPVVRAYNVQDRFIVDNENRLDENNRAYWALMASNRWLGIRLEFIGNCIILCASMFMVAFRPDPALTGLALSNAIQVTGWLSWLVRMNTEMEMAMNSVERVIHYINVDSEAAAIIPDNRPPKSWPARGEITFDHLEVRYRPDLPAVINDLSCTIRGGEKIGVVGRTGAGKTTFVQCLFRLVEATAGKLLIDGLDVSSIGLTDLRSRLSVVPQDPVLFSGPLRANLDPFNHYDTADIWKALERVQLRTHVESLPDKLETKMSEGGSNFSVGERQLLCMARALLRHSQILVMDEATANIDTKTDALIQDTIRSAFATCTVLTIAHRLNTIIDADRVMVLDKGSIAEFASPAELLSNPQSHFTQMVAQTGGASASYLQQAAVQAQQAKQAASAAAVRDGPIRAQLPAATDDSDSD